MLIIYITEERIKQVNLMRKIIRNYQIVEKIRRSFISIGGIVRVRIVRQLVQLQNVSVIIDLRSTKQSILKIGQLVVIRRSVSVSTITIYLFMDLQILSVYASTHIRIIILIIRIAKNVLVSNLSLPGVAPVICNFLIINQQQRPERRG